MNTYGQTYVCVSMSEINVPSEFLLPEHELTYMFTLCRLLRKRVAPVQQRCLSGADVVNALRPFYFAVHPDFFAQYPKERVGV